MAMPSLVLPITPQAVTTRWLRSSQARALSLSTSMEMRGQASPIAQTAAMTLSVASTGAAGAFNLYGDAGKNISNHAAGGDDSFTLSAFANTFTIYGDAGGN